MNGGFVKTVLALLIAGGFNLGLMGLFNFDLVAFLFLSSRSFAARVVYVTFAARAAAAIPLLIWGVEGKNKNRKDR